MFEHNIPKIYLLELMNSMQRKQSDLLKINNLHNQLFKQLASMYRNYFCYNDSENERINKKYLKKLSMGWIMLYKTFQIKNLSLAQQQILIISPLLSIFTGGNLVEQKSSSFILKQFYDFTVSSK